MPMAEEDAMRGTTLRISEEEIAARLREKGKIEEQILKLSKQAKDIDPYMHCSCWSNYPNTHRKCTSYECVQNCKLAGTRRVKTICRRLKGEFDG